MNLSRSQFARLLRTPRLMEFTGGVLRRVLFQEFPAGFTSYVETCSRAGEQLASDLSTLAETSCLQGLDAPPIVAWLRNALTLLESQMCPDSQVIDDILWELGWPRESATCEQVDIYVGYPSSGEGTRELTRRLAATRRRVFLQSDVGSPNDFPGREACRAQRAAALTLLILERATPEFYGRADIAQALSETDRPAGRVVPVFLGRRSHFRHAPQLLRDVAPFHVGRTADLNAAVERLVALIPPPRGANPA